MTEIHTKGVKNIRIQPKMHYHFLTNDVAKLARDGCNRKNDEYQI